jgi:Flp pilus assembly protein TadG
MRPVRARERRDTERGVSAVEFVLLTPVLFFLLFATVQFAMFFFARHVAIAAAQEGARVARAEAGDPRFAATWQRDATDKARGWVNQLAPSLLGNLGVPPPQSHVQGADWTVSVTVTANVPSLFPWASMSVSETSTGPVERFVPDR